MQAREWGFILSRAVHPNPNVGFVRSAGAYFLLVQPALSLLRGQKAVKLCINSANHLPENRA